MSEVQTLEGRLHKIFAKQTVSSSFSKREFVIETDEQYPQMVKLELTQDKCDDICAYKEGDKISVNFNIRGREWSNPKTNEMNYFITLQAWKINSNSTTTDTSSKPKTEKKSKDTSSKTPLDDTMSDDLPF